MSEEENKQSTEVSEEIAEETKEDTIDYQEELIKVKKNSVSKEEYDKLKQEHKKLLNEFINSSPSTSKAPIDIEERKKSLRDELANKELTNIDYWDKALELRDLCVETGDGDPFLPNSGKQGASADNVMEAEKVTEYLRKCLKEANGDPETFNVLLSRIK